MNRIVALSAMLLLPWISGCCCCGGHSSCGGCGSSCGGYTSSPGGYNNCLSYDDAYAQDCGKRNCKNCNCNGDEEFSLPPEPTNSTAYTAPYGTYYGPEIVGPEIIGPVYDSNGTEWQVVPSNPVTPAAPGSTAGPTPLSSPMPIPPVSNSSIVVPPPSPVPMSTSPMVVPDATIPVAPPPPPEPVTQMRFRQYR